MSKTNAFIVFLLTAIVLYLLYGALDLVLMATSLKTHENAVLSVVSSALFTLYVWATSESNSYTRY